jgi:putative glutamine amidotransferase
MPSPIIGLPLPRAYDDAAKYDTPTAYTIALEAAGGVPCHLPLLAEDGLERLFGVIDGLLLTGGGDVAAACYDAADGGRLVLVDEERDRVELWLCRRALAAGLPVMGICRGAQVLNVAAGGTLIQDIAAERPGSLNHRTQPPLPNTHRLHTVAVDPASQLAGWLAPGDGEMAAMPVTSTHHQAVAAVAPGFSAVAFAPDGIIEAIERPVAAGFALGIQWHPERMVPDHAPTARLFAAFVAACRS